MQEQRVIITGPGKYRQNGKCDETGEPLVAEVVGKSVDGTDIGPWVGFSHDGQARSWNAYGRASKGFREADGERHDIVERLMTQAAAELAFTRHQYSPSEQDG